MHRLILIALLTVMPVEADAEKKRRTEAEIIALLGPPPQPPKKPHTKEELDEWLKLASQYDSEALVCCAPNSLN